MLIERIKYLKNIVKFSEQPLIKVITGQRRAGKSSILMLLIEQFRKKYASANIIYLNKEFYEYDPIKTAKDLTKHIYKLLDSDKKNFVFIDEVQDIENFESALRDLIAKKKADVYISGSNAKMLSGDLATTLSGRYVEFNIKPLSYSEFLLFHNLEKGNESLDKYLRFGGMPYLINLPMEEDVIQQYLRSIYDTVILKDIVYKHSIRNVDFLMRLSCFLSDNIGQLVSSNSISAYLKSQKINISVKMVMDYLHYLANAFFISKVARVDIVGKKIFEVNEKYYFEDIGLRNMLIGYKSADISKLIENVVYNQLRFLGYDVHIGKFENYEIDFVCAKAGETIYVQTTYLMPDEKTMQREFGTLLKIKDNYKKYVVSMDPIAGGNYKGIVHLNLIEFLLLENL